MNDATQEQKAQTPDGKGSASRNDTERASDELRPIHASVEVVRKSDELGIIWGWVSAADVVDLQDETVPQDELVTAFYQFMEDYYLRQATIRENHGDEPEVILVESCLEFRGATLRWWAGVKLLTEELREAARNGEISGFSIGGTARRESE